MAVEEENEELRAAAHEVLDTFDRGGTSEALRVAMLKLRSAAGITSPAYDTEEEIYRTLTGSGLTRRQLFWGAVLILFWFTMDVIGFALDHIVPIFK
jgi:hypothetical protein